MYKPRLKEHYENTVKPALQSEFKYVNHMQMPAIEKIVINMGVGEATKDSKSVKNRAEELALIAGQRPVITKAKNSHAGFKVREGMGIGCKVTLRGNRMYEFLDRLLTIALPRVRDFRGLSDKSFDGRGNYAFGVKEQIIFPEIDYDKVDQISGMDIIVVTTANTNQEAKHMLTKFGFPFRVN